MSSFCPSLSFREAAVLPRPPPPRLLFRVLHHLHGVSGKTPPALLVSSSSSQWWESGRETRRLGGCLMRGLQYIVNVVNGFSSLRQPARIICTFDLSDSSHSGKSAFRWNGTAAPADARELHHEPCRFMLISRNRHGYNIIWHQLSYFPVKRKIVHLIFLIRDFSQFTLSCNISLWPTC